MKRLLKWLEKALRHGIVYPLLRTAFRNPIRELPLNISKVKKILILRYDRIGDIIVTTPIFRKLKHVRPDVTLGVFASPSNAEIVASDPHVDRIHVLRRNWWYLMREIQNARREQYDVVLNFIFNRTTSGGILSNLIAPNGVKVGQGAEVYRFYFNALLHLDRGSKHMVQVLAEYVESVFGLTWNPDELLMSVSVDEDSRRRVDAFLAEKRLARRHAAGTHYAVLNLSAVDEVRRTTPGQSAEIARGMSVQRGIPTVLISAPGESSLQAKVREMAGNGPLFRYPAAGRAGLREIASLIEGALFVVTPDTSIVHFAAAVNTPVLGLYTPLQVTAEWMPYGVEHRTVFAPEGRPVSSIDATAVLNAMAGFPSPSERTRDDRTG